MDDDKSILKSLRKVFESEGYRVDTAETGREAIQKSKAWFYNLALIDIKLPDMKGTELLKEMHESLPRMVKIMLTGYPDLENAIASVNLGADAYFVKPADPRRLLKVVEEKLREQEEAEEVTREKLKRLFMDNPEAVAYTDQDFHVLDVNQSFVDLFGYSPTEIKGKCINDVIVPEQEVNKAEMSDKKPVEGRGYFETIRKRKDGSLVHVSILVAPIAVEDRLMGHVEFYKDITERKQMEEALAYERDLLHALMDNVPDAIYFKDRESRFTSVNKAHAQRMGVGDPEETVGKTDLDFYSEEFAKEAYEDEQRILKSGQPLVGKAEKIEKGGQVRWVSATKVPIKDKDGKVTGLVGISRDITGLKQMEEELRLYSERLEELVKERTRTNQALERANAELESYTYVVSHDLKAPLRTILSFSTFLLEDYSDRIDETGRDYLKRILKAAENMNALIGDLLLLSQVGRKFTEVEKVDLNNILGEILTDLGALIEKRDGPVVVNDLPTIYVQKTWVKQLFTNLIDNGLKFNKSKNPKVEVKCDVREKDYLFAVCDNGIGIEKQYFERIFNLFERLNPKEEYEGTGAGLSICKKIVENLGGSIWVESTPGEGSTFFFTIPRKGTDQ